MQTYTAFLFFYVFGLAAVIMTWYVVRAIIKFLHTKKKEEQKQQKEEQLLDSTRTD